MACRPVNSVDVPVSLKPTGFWYTFTAVELARDPLLFYSDLHACTTEQMDPMQKRDRFCVQQ